ncbi:hypothetical protein G7Y31_08365 [Corynebacterium lizhenjunii]|uniref:Secreted protein n=1 Tax=Corynebacterium lizhenjunii TaxID=2709394 RepID=A0A7T0KDV2_9CORY|nr:hypothetical protein [Corynebacterium lizhenjunii]QPK78566.1 hypothetical protein G7Y31_08365 [Corynebacterium lizhenjunii]
MMRLRKTLTAVAVSGALAFAVAPVAQAQSSYAFSTGDIYYQHTSGGWVESSSRATNPAPLNNAELEQSDRIRKMIENDQRARGAAGSSSQNITGADTAARATTDASAGGNASLSVEGNATRETTGGANGGVDINIDGNTDGNTGGNNAGNTGGNATGTSSMVNDAASQAASAATALNGLSSVNTPNVPNSGTGNGNGGSSLTGNTSATGGNTGGNGGGNLNGGSSVSPELAGIILPGILILGGLTWYLNQDGQTYMSSQDRVHETPTREEKATSSALLSSNAGSVREQAIQQTSAESERGVSAETGDNTVARAMFALLVMSVLGAAGVFTRRKFA